MYYQVDYGPVTKVYLWLPLALPHTDFLEQSNKIRAVFGAGFAVLLGLGIAAVFHTFRWENSVTLVAGTYDTLSRLDGIAYSSKAAEAAGLRFASTSDDEAGGRMP